ncbi:MAG: ABC transporter permease [Sphaerospermopsis sp. SIO1G2]|nr:ABC transporter permease [Sphaerospermopsis sp. SIO1G2]
MSLYITGTQPNWIGIWTVYRREVWRFTKVWNQTVIAPVITTLLFLAVLTLALGSNRRSFGELPFDQFVAPGLIMMAVVQNAFANSSSSLMLAKIQGVIIDLLMPPLKGWEITLGFVAGGVTRGIMVGVAVMLAVYIFVPFSIHSPWLLLFYLIMSSIMLALLGMLGGVYAQAFDQLSAFTNYIITPLSFLSGTFYSIHQLPAFWQQVSLYNPFFYMIDGCRYAMTGYADGDVTYGMIMMIGVNLALWTLVQHLFSKGWRLRS